MRYDTQPDHPDTGPRPSSVARYDPDDGDNRRREVLDEREWQRMEERLAANLANVMAGNAPLESDDATV